MNKSGFFELPLVDGRTIRIDGSRVHIEYEINNGDGTKEIKLSNCVTTYRVKDIPAKVVNRLVFDAYIINVLDKDCSLDKFNGVERFVAQRASLLTEVKSIYPFLDPQLHSLTIDKKSAVHDTCMSSYCLLLLGNEDQQEYENFMNNLVGGLTIKSINAGLSETSCSSIKYGDEADIIMDVGSIFSENKVPHRSFNYADYLPDVEAICSQKGLSLE